VKILVCSDSHGDTESLDKIVKLHPKEDMYLHLGDSQLPNYLTGMFITVKGNCDFFPYPERIDIPTKWGKIHMEHGDYYLARTKKYIEEQECFIYLFGHTHVRQSGYDGKTYVFNPGSLTEPRDRNEGSYLLIAIDDETGKLKYHFEDFVF